MGMEAPYEIWLQLAQWLQRRRCFKMLTYDIRCTTDGGGMPIIIIIIIISLFQEDNIFGTNASLTYGPQLQR